METSLGMKAGFKKVDCTYTDRFANQLWELPGVHLTSGREGSIATDLALEIELGLAVLCRSAWFPSRRKIVLTRDSQIDLGLICRFMR
jgi:hypothetical protein